MNVLGVLIAASTLIVFMVLQTHQSISFHVADDATYVGPRVLQEVNVSVQSTIPPEPWC